jgi:5-methylcytosine-specific restriction endonuclease McrA
MLNDFIDIKLPTFNFDIEFEDEKREAGTLSYKKWRRMVFTRDYYTCQICHTEYSEDKLEAHHIKPFSIAPELQFDVNNGLTLCHKCHVKTDSYGRKGSMIKQGIKEAKKENVKH